MTRLFVRSSCSNVASHNGISQTIVYCASLTHVYCETIMSHFAQLQMCPEPLNGLSVWFSGLLGHTDCRLDCTTTTWWVSHRRSLLKKLANILYPSILIESWKECGRKGCTIPTALRIVKHSPFKKLGPQLESVLQKPSHTDVSGTWTPTSTLLVSSHSLTRDNVGKRPNFVV